MGASSLARAEVKIRSPSAFQGSYVPGRLDAEVRLTGDWESWLAFFGEAVCQTAGQAALSARELVDLAERDRESIASIGRAAASAREVHRASLQRPIATAGRLVHQTGLTPATVNRSLAHLAHLGIIRELTDRRRNRLFSYPAYLRIVNRGTESPET